MQVYESFTLFWCEKHNNWWVTNCPDCMVDANEESIKQDGRKEVVEWVCSHRLISPDDDSISRFEPFYQITQSELKEWGIKI